MKQYFLIVKTPKSKESPMRGFVIIAQNMEGCLYQANYILENKVKDGQLLEIRKDGINGKVLKTF